MISANETRLPIREGRHTGPTAGMGSGLMQANLVILDADHAIDFETFCHLNPRPCPLLAKTEIGDPRLPALGHEIDLRTDLPGYRIWRNGAVDEVVPDITELWKPRFVGFALGCSFGFEQALVEKGIELAYLSSGRNVAMYDTNIPLKRSGNFGGSMVVSMRFIAPADISRVVDICTSFPACHGAPIQIGNPGQLGIKDLSNPDYGDYMPGSGGDVPVFWACGVTPQAALVRARLPFAITHVPGKMLICDRPASSITTL